MLLVTAAVSGGGSARGKAPSGWKAAGTLRDGATYLMEVPARWNGTVLLFGHGMVTVEPGREPPNPAKDAPGWGDTRELLLDEGYALIGSSYVSPGWVVDSAVGDQIATLTAFEDLFGPARRTLAWGESLGGMITTKLAEEYGDRIDGSLSTCGTVAGGVARWNNQLDLSFALRTLLAPGSGIRLTGFRDPAQADASAAALGSATARAQRTPWGRARIALAAALAGVAGYNAPDQRQPGPGDWATTEANQYAIVSGTLIPSTTRWRRDAESHAGGSMSWNSGVDYSAMLARSPHREEARALYRSAGLSLAADLSALGHAPRLDADGSAVGFMARTSSYSGRLTKPQLDVHTVHDGLVPVQNERAYADSARASGSSSLLRQTYVRRAGHCAFTRDEALAAVHALDRRVATGHWGDTGARAMNAAAHERGAVARTAYVPSRPPPFPRPYDLERQGAGRPGGLAAPGSVRAGPRPAPPTVPADLRTRPYAGGAGAGD
ncbi:alpha/beta hydrolase [Streptomyces sp. TS71-3]|nr:alpha/beta hydrolase [Streptomyces sp. TS71-3]